MSEAFIIGLTGSIGMGKTTTAKIFDDLGVPIWDADAAVHRIYGPNGAAADPISALCPEAVSEKGVDRDALKRWMDKDPTALKQLEEIVHPLVATDRAAFLAGATAPIVVLDMPLLFEIGAHEHVDMVAVVSTSPEVQKARVMQRGTLTEQQFNAILSKQTPDAEKRARADVIIPTDTPEGAKAAVEEVIAHVKERLKNA